MKSSRGFTLIELLIVVAIIAILAAIAVPNFLEAQTRSKVSRAKADLRSLATAAESYAVDNNVFPPNGTATQVVAFLEPLKRLSTPIAYITTGQLRDPFGNIEFQDDPVWNGNYVYYFFNLGMEDGLMYIVYQALIPDVTPEIADHNEEVAVINSHRYALFSTGPDKIMEFDRVYYPPPFGEGASGPVAGAQAQARVFMEGRGAYDPTNGTNSKGDILRTGKGFQEQGKSR